MSINFNGLEEVTKEMERLANPQNLTAALKKACALVERSAKTKAPKGDGHLRRSIQSRIDSEDGELQGVVFTTLEYAPYVEYGTGLFAEEGGRTDVPWLYKDEKGEWHSTSGMEPRPYMRPALDENREQIKRILKEGLTKK